MGGPTEAERQKLRERLEKQLDRLGLQTAVELLETHVTQAEIDDTFYRELLRGQEVARRAVTEAPKRAGKTKP